jgi:hypothetical protein
MKFLGLDVLYSDVFFDLPATLGLARPHLSVITFALSLPLPPYV